MSPRPLMDGLTVLVGGARSGKSNLAVHLGTRHDGAVCFIATAEAFDVDMRERIERHRTERPPWPTVEAPVHLADAVRGVVGGSLVIVDCLTVWVGNLFASELPNTARESHYRALTAALGERSDPTIVISNEVGLGLHPETSLGREYRDELGRLNQGVAAVADHALLLVAGRALRLADPLEMLS